MAFDPARLNELQGILREKVASNNEIADSFEIKDGTVHVEEGQKAAFDVNMAAIKEIKSLVEGQEAMRDVDSWANGGDAAESLSIKSAATLAVAEQLGVRGKSLGQMFTESEEFKSLQQGRAGLTMNSPFEFGRADMVGANAAYAQKDVYSSMASLPATLGFGGVDFDPMVLPPQRTRRVRDLFPARATTSPVVEYFRVTGFTNNAAPVAQRDGGGGFALKPQSSLAFTGQQAPVRTLAHWEAAHRNVLADEPQLRSIIDNELMYGLRLEEDMQILSGDGTGENLLGVLLTSGVQTYAWSNGAINPVPDNKGDAIRRAATLAFLAYYEPTGVVVHPSDWEDMELTKSTQGQYLMAVSMSTGADQRIWRLPVIDTPAIAQGTALVGAFGTGAQLYDREQSNIRVAEQHADFFTRNAVVVLAEERLALAVKRPESFVVVSFDGAPTAI
jgi:hypothetical protein